MTPQTSRVPSVSCGVGVRPRTDAREWEVQAPPLRECVEQVYILAWREETAALEKALGREGLATRVLRPEYGEADLRLSRMTRCLMNHRNAWRACSAGNGLSMVVEADFVPCIGIGSRPPPFPWTVRDRAWGWLYAGGPRLYEIWPGGQLRGHSACPVATVMGPAVASALVDFADSELSKRDGTTYFPWDTYIQYHAKQRGVLSFIPFRQYGEHGGLPNPEHRGGGMGMGGGHQAETLCGPLHFLPAYALGSRLRYRRVRAMAKLRGVARLISGRFAEPGILRECASADMVAKFLFVGLRRLFAF